MKKIFFYDLGIRNALIRAFQPLHLRNDVGALFENFLIIERMKWRAYKGLEVNQFFWRGVDQEEVDLLEIRNDIIESFEIKYS